MWPDGFVSSRKTLYEVVPLLVDSLGAEVDAVHYDGAGGEVGEAEEGEEEGGLAAARPPHDPRPLPALHPGGSTPLGHPPAIGTEREDNREGRQRGGETEGGVGRDSETSKSEG